MYGLSSDTIYEIFSKGKPGSKIYSRLCVPILPMCQSLSVFIGIQLGVIGEQSWFGAKVSFGCPCCAGATCILSILMVARHNRTT